MIPTHEEIFPDVPNNWKNEMLSNRWQKLLKIRDICNISIEQQRANKIIGSSLEASVQIKLNKEFYEEFKNFNFEELLIISKASVKLDDQLNIITTKANGEKCPVCWKIRQGKCERHG